MKKIIYLLIICLHFSVVYSQNYTGKVVGKESSGNEALPGAVVFWNKTNIGVRTDVNGNFVIPFPDSMPAKLVVSMVGYSPDTILVKEKININQNIELTKITTLETVEIVKETESVMISFNTLKTEIVTEKELKKAACCNLGESFETNASVDITYKDAVSGSKEIQVLGLSGAYVQLLTENAPLINGLGLTYGLNSIPGTQIHSISIIKGPASVVFGPESMSGMVNIDLKDPITTHKLFMNAYLDYNLRKELNIDKQVKLNDKSSVLLMGHASHVSQKIDNNQDGFLDMPLLTTYNVLGKYKYSHRGFVTQHTLKYLNETREAGQLNYDFRKNEIDSAVYAQQLITNRIELYGKAGWILPSEKYNSIGIQYSAVNHLQQGFYGIRNYNGEQQNANIRFLYNSQINKYNTLNTGLSYKHDNINEKLDTFVFNRLQNIPGAFIENTFEKNKIIALIAGIRADWYQNRIFITPRFNIKYSLADKTDLRASMATGWKMTDILAENSSLAASNRKIVISEKLNPEESLNYGINLNHEFEIAFRKGSIGVDAYQTRFMNKVYADFDSLPAEVLFYNIRNNTLSNSLQVEMIYEIIKQLDLKVAYKYLDVYSTINGNRMTHPLIAKHRVLANLFYETFNRKWNMNATWQWYSKKRLPETIKYPAEYRMPSYSKPYSKINMQVNRIYKHNEWYIGVENLLNFVQHDAIISTSEPYGPYFDTGFAWGTMDNRRIYLGWRYKM